MTKYKTFEIVLILVTILVIIIAVILIKNPTIVGYTVTEEYVEYTNNINLEEAIIPQFLENNTVYSKIEPHKLSNY